MAGFSDYLEDAIINLTLRNTSLSAVAQPYVALHTQDPGDTGVPAGGVTSSRVAVEFDAPSGGATQNTNIETFASVAAGTYVYLSVWDASSGGNCLYTGSLTASKTADLGDSIVFAVGELDVSLT